MADQWFVLRGEQKTGPFSPSELKHLAASSQLLPTDQVWKEGIASWVPASKLSGLFIASATASAQPSTQATKVSPEIERRPSEPKVTFFDRAKAGVADFAQTAKAAAQLTAKQAERTKITQLNLPSAYAGLGNHLHTAGTVRASFGTLHDTLDQILRDIRAVEAHTSSQPQPQRLTDKAKAAAISVKDAAHIKALQLKARGAYTELGKAAFDKGGDQAGPAELTMPIRDCLNRLSILDTEIARLSTTTPGKRITPKRLAIAGGIVLLVGILGSLAKPSKVQDIAESHNVDATQQTQQATATNGGVNGQLYQSLVEQQTTSTIAVDPLFSRIDYSQGPQGQKIEEQFAPETTTTTAQTRHGYVSDGKFVDHGVLTVWYEPPGDGQPGKKKAEGYYFGGTPHGVSYEWNAEGVKTSERYFLNGKLHGSYITWYANGTKETEKLFADGEREGLHVTWYDSGKPARAVAYRKGKRHGKYQEWNNLGELYVDLEYENDEPKAVDRRSNSRRAFVVVFDLHDDWYLYQFTTDSQKMERLFGKPDSDNPSFHDDYSRYWSFRFNDGTLSMAVRPWGGEVFIWGHDYYPPVYGRAYIQSTAYTQAQFNQKVVETLGLRPVSKLAGAAECSANKWFTAFGHPARKELRGIGNDRYWVSYYKLRDGEQPVQFLAKWDTSYIVFGESK